MGHTVIVVVLYPLGVLLMGWLFVAFFDEREYKITAGGIVRGVVLAMLWPGTTVLILLLVTIDIARQAAKRWRRRHG